MFSKAIVFTCLVPRYQWVFSNAAENAGTQKLSEIRKYHMFYMNMHIFYQENEKFGAVISM